jgi:hypothetical protein
MSKTETHRSVDEVVEDLDLHVVVSDKTLNSNLALGTVGSSSDPTDESPPRAESPQR